jgi:hypothetical protein
MKMKKKRTVGLGFGLAAMISMSFVVMMFGAYGNAHAAVHYVDNAANGANNGSSWSNAWESFGAISWGSIGAGDTIYISGGSSSKVYSETLEIGAATGTSGSPIKITKGTESGHNGEVIIDGGNSRSNGINSRISGRNYFRISNLTVRNHQAQEVRIENATGTVIENIRIPDSTCTGVRFRYNTGCTIRGIHYDTVNMGGSVETDGIFLQDSTNTTIEYNYIEVSNENTSTHDDCFQQGAGTTWAGGGTFRGNYCNQNNRDTVNAQGIFWEDAKGTWNIYNNVVDGHDYVKNLINFKNARASAVLNIYNNTIKGGSSQAGSIVRVQAMDSITVRMKNNIGYSTSSNQSIVNLSGTMTDDINYNIWYCPNNANGYDGSSWSGWQSRGYDSQGYNSNPLLGSECRVSDVNAPGHDGGTAIGLFSIDRDGVNRPQGLTWDIGAYECVSGGGVIAKPSPPLNLRVVGLQ